MDNREPAVNFSSSIILWVAIKFRTIIWPLTINTTKFISHLAAVLDCVSGWLMNLLTYWLTSLIRLPISSLISLMNSPTHPLIDWHSLLCHPLALTKRDFIDNAHIPTSCKPSTSFNPFGLS